jgi:hypothetical protein
MDTTQYIGVIALVLLAFTELLYINYQRGILDNQTLVIEDLVFENTSLKQLTTAQRETIGNLTDSVQLHVLEQWGNEAAQRKLYGLEPMNHDNDLIDNLIEFTD